MPDIFVTGEAGQDPITPDEKIHTPEPDGVPAGRPHNKLAAFSLYPDDVNFETKDEKERVILLLRQHPIVNLKWILVTLVLLTGPSILKAFGIFSLMPVGFGLVISLAWYLVTTAYAIEGFLNWYFNVYFVTTQRIVDVDFYNLIDKRVSNAEIEKIQDVSYTTGGVGRTMLNYGDVFIQTAAEVPEFTFEGVPNPEKVVKILDDLRAKV